MMGEWFGCLLFRHIHRGFASTSRRRSKFGERVFKPLGMATARVISEADIVPNRAAGYLLSSGVLK